MANGVFANGRELACKKAKGKSICAFPDVCFTPPDKVPPTPPGVPVPYPNTAMASDTAKGSKKVKISGAEIMLKNKSHFKKSMGDEAGVAQKKGLVSSQNRGKAYFTMWSMDVKIEGQNAVRHMDMTTHNHGSMPPNSPPWLYVDGMAVGIIADGADDDSKNDPPLLRHLRGLLDLAIEISGVDVSSIEKPQLSKENKDIASGWLD